jgi:ribosomal protein S18 acetylase RimI-like enzyme
MNFTFSTISKIDLPCIKNLWQKLNDLHMNSSIHFKEHYKAFSFEERCGKFIDTPDDRIRIEIIRDNETCVGYCIVTIDNATGEIDSLYVEPDYRNYGLGAKLVNNCSRWLKENGCRHIGVSVAAGHESVFGFYRKFNFFPRKTWLQLKDPDDVDNNR